MSKVLLTNHHLKTVGGSETWVHTMAQEFDRRGWDVHVYTPNPGLFSLMMSEFCYVNKDFHDSYDLILINHSTTQSFVENIKGPKIYTCHGLAIDVEIPIPGFDVAVAISEEVQLGLAKKFLKFYFTSSLHACVLVCPVKSL